LLAPPPILDLAVSPEVAIAQINRRLTDIMNVVVGGLVFLAVLLFLFIR
jgi:hypothetical protein